MWSGLLKGGAFTVLFCNCCETGENWEDSESRPFTEAAFHPFILRDYARSAVGTGLKLSSGINCSTTVAPTTLELSSSENEANVTVTNSHKDKKQPTVYSCIFVSSHFKIREVFFRPNCWRGEEMCVCDTPATSAGRLVQQQLLWTGSSAVKSKETFRLHFRSKTRTGNVNQRDWTLMLEQWLLVLHLLQGKLDCFSGVLVTKSTSSKEKGKQRKSQSF